MNGLDEIALFAIQVVGRQESPVTSLTYSEFTQHVGADRVESVTFRDRSIEGEFTQPIRDEDREYVRFRSMLPGELSEGLLQELESRGVIIDAELPQRGIGPANCWSSYTVTRPATYSNALSRWATVTLKVGVGATVSGPSET